LKCSHKISIISNSIPLELPKTTILVDHGYHPEKIIPALEQIYPQIMTKIQFELSAKPSKAEKEACMSIRICSGVCEMGDREIQCLGRAM
jgi:hypothetical protein